MKTKHILIAGLLAVLSSTKAAPVESQAETGKGIRPQAKATSATKPAPAKLLRSCTESTKCVWRTGKLDCGTEYRYGIIQTVMKGWYSDGTTRTWTVEQPA